MLRASSGKHARLVGVCAAGGDSVPRRRGAGDLFFFGWSIFSRTVFQPPQHKPPTHYLQHFGVSGVPELKRYARRVSRTQAIRSLFFEIAKSSTLSETRKSNFLNVLHFFDFFRLRPVRIRNAVDLDCVNGPGPPPAVQICYLQHFGVLGVPELKRYAHFFLKLLIVLHFRKPENPIF